MMTDHQGHIEQYLKGELSREEVTIFEEKLEQDAVLKEQVDQYRQLLKGLEIGFNKELKALLLDEESKIIDIPSHRTSRIKTLYPLIGMAAAVAFIIVAYFSIRKDPLSPEALYAQYYEVYPNVEAPVSRSENVDENPYAYYERGDYITALKLFTDLRTSDPENSALLFYSGICQLELGQPGKSIELFDQVINLESAKYLRPAIWYQSLAYLHMGNIEKATVIFDQLKQGDDVYSRKAKNLFENL